MSRGIFHLLLHAHLPFVRQAEKESSLAEYWFFEAIIESYIPLLLAFERLDRDGIDFHLNFSLSPTLLSMLDDDLLKERFLCHSKRVRCFMNDESLRVQSPQQKALLAWYRQHFESIFSFYEQCDGDIISRFVYFAKKGNLELLTTSATHAVLPLYQNHPASIEAQVHVGLDYFEEKTGLKSRGFWLPECAYYVGFESVLERSSVDYFYLESTALSESDSLLNSSKPARIPSGAVVLARDPMCSELVWSSKKGYPGHASYREYYSERIHELSEDEAQAFLLDDGVRIGSGLKYRRVTGHAAKEWYSPELAQLAIQEQASDFCERMEKSVLQANEDRVFVAPYDAELLGHWWFEGPLWLESVYRQIHRSSTLESMSGSELCKSSLTVEMGQPKASSWGKNADFSFWVSKENDWIYPLLFDAEKRMIKVLQNYSTFNELEERLVKQLIRSLLLAQSSDWPFILKNQTVVNYAKERLQGHLTNIEWALSSLSSGEIDRRILQAVESMEFIFKNIQIDFFLEKKK